MNRDSEIRPTDGGKDNSISRRGLLAGMAVLAGLGLSGIAAFAADYSEDHGNGAAGQYHWGDYYNHCLYNGNGFGCASSWLKWTAYPGQDLRVAFAVEMWSNYTNPLYEFCRLQAYSQCGDTNNVSAHRLWYARVEDNFIDYYWNGSLWRTDTGAFAWTNEFLGPGYGQHDTLMHTFGYQGTGWIERKDSDYRAMTLGATLNIFNVTHGSDLSFVDVYPGVKFDPSNAAHRQWVQFALGTQQDCGGDLTAWLDKILIFNRYDLFGAIVTLKNRYSGSYLTVPKGGSTEWERVAQQARGDMSTCGCFAVGIGANDDAFGDFLHRLHPVSSKGWKSVLYGESGRTILGLGADSSNYPAVDSGLSNAYYEKLWTWNSPDSAPSSRFMDFWITDDLQKTAGYSQLICDETGLSLSLTHNSKSDGADVCLWCDGNWKGTLGVAACDWKIEEAVFNGTLEFEDLAEEDTEAAIKDPATTTLPTDSVGSGSVRYLTRFLICTSGEEVVPGERRVIGAASQAPRDISWYKEGYANRCVGFPHASSNLIYGFYLKAEDGTGSICYQVKPTADSEWSETCRDGAWTSRSASSRVCLARVWLEGELADSYDLSLRVCTSASGWGERVFTFKAVQDDTPILGIGGESIVSLQATLIPRPAGCTALARDFDEPLAFEIPKGTNGFIYAQTVMAMNGTSSGIHQMADMFRGTVTCSSPLKVGKSMARVRYFSDGIDDGSVIFEDEVAPGPYTLNPSADSKAIRPFCNLNGDFGNEVSGGFNAWFTDKGLGSAFVDTALEADSVLDLFGRNRCTLRIEYAEGSLVPEEGVAYVSKPKDGASPVGGALELPDFTGLSEYHTFDGIELPAIGDNGAGHMATYYGERVSLAAPAGAYRKMGDGTWRHIVCDAYLTDKAGGGRPCEASRWCGTPRSTSGGATPIRTASPAQRNRYHPGRRCGLRPEPARVPFGRCA